MEQPNENDWKQGAAAAGVEDEVVERGNEETTSSSSSAGVSFEAAKDSHYDCNYAKEGDANAATTTTALQVEAHDETMRIIGASAEDTAKILANAASNSSNLHQYASLRSLSARGLNDLQKKMNCLNSPTIHAASALLAASAPPVLALGANNEPPLIPAPRYGSAAMTIRTLGPDERKRVPHIYHDYGQVPDTQTFVRKKTGGVTQPFPEKLMDMLNRESGSIVEWLPHGRAFIVRKSEEFTSIIMPKYFRQTKITSFQRQLNLYGFRRITQGADSGAYYHELFLRGRPNLCAQMVRTKVKGTGHKQPSDATSEPNFYTMPAQPPLSNVFSSKITSDDITNSNSIVSAQSESHTDAVVPFSPHLHGAANLLTGIAQGHNVDNLPELNLGDRMKSSNSKLLANQVRETSQNNNFDPMKYGEMGHFQSAPSPLPGDAGEVENNGENGKQRIECL